MGLGNEEGSTEKASDASSKARCAWLSQGLTALAKKTQRKAAEHSCCGGALQTCQALVEARPVGLAQISSSRDT